MMAIDGTVLDVPDSKANARVWGYPGSRRGTQAAFPKVRLVMRSSCRNTFDSGRFNMSLPYRRATEGKKTSALSRQRDVVNVGQRAAFICNGQHYPGSRVPLFGTNPEER